MGGCLRQPRDGVIIASLRIFRDVIITRSRLRLSRRSGGHVAERELVGAKEESHECWNERQRDREELIRVVDFFPRPDLARTPRVSSSLRISSWVADVVHSRVVAAIRGGRVINSG